MPGKRPDDEPGNFGMEHLQSSTFFGDTSGIHTQKAGEKELWSRIPSYLHHMAHAYIPLRWIYRYLYEWSVRTGRPFSMEEFPGLLKEATGLDISAIYNKWQGPVGDPPAEK